MLPSLLCVVLKTPLRSATLASAWSLSRLARRLWTSSSVNTAVSRLRPLSVTFTDWRIVSASASSLVGPELTDVEDSRRIASAAFCSRSGSMCRIK